MELKKDDEEEEKEVGYEQERVEGWKAELKKVEREVELKKVEREMEQMKVEQKKVERDGMEEGGEKDGMEEGGEGGEINDSTVDWLEVEKRQDWRRWRC